MSRETLKIIQQTRPHFVGKCEFVIPILLKEHIYHTFQQELFLLMTAVLLKVSETLISV